MLYWIGPKIVALIQQFKLSLKVIMRAGQTNLMEKFSVKQCYFIEIQFFLQECVDFDAILNGIFLKLFEIEMEYFVSTLFFHFLSTFLFGFIMALLFHFNVTFFKVF